MRLNLTKKEWNLIIKALSSFSSIKDDEDKRDEEENNAWGLTEKVNDEFCKNYSV